MEKLYLSVAIFSLLAAASATFLLIKIANKLQLVATPTSDRWHSKSTPILGGIAIFLGALAGILSALLFDSPLSTDLIHKSLTILLGSTAMFAVGLFDDLRTIRPLAKLILQLCVSIIYLLLAELSPLSFVLALFWIIGITNAINLLDNMDGLAAGTCIIASLFFFLLGIKNSNYSLALLSLIILGATSGFIIFNLNPARIFMGDAGSLFLGFSLSVLSLLSIGAPSISFSSLLLPSLILALPIFDTTFVTFRRLASGKSITQGGRDHTSHSLVAKGFSEKFAVNSLLAISLTVSFSALAISLLRPVLSTSLIGIVIFGFVWLGYYLRAASKDQSAV